MRIRCKDLEPMIHVGAPVLPNILSSHYLASTPKPTMGQDTNKQTPYLPAYLSSNLLLFFPYLLPSPFSTFKQQRSSLAAARQLTDVRSVSFITSFLPFFPTLFSLHIRALLMLASILSTYCPLRLELLLWWGQSLYSILSRPLCQGGLRVQSKVCSPSNFSLSV